MSMHCPTPHSPMIIRRSWYWFLKRKNNLFSTQCFQSLGKMTSRFRYKKYSEILDCKLCICKYEPIGSATNESNNTEITHISFNRYLMFILCS